MSPSQNVDSVYIQDSSMHDFPSILIEDIAPEQVMSPVLKRLIEEVKNEVDCSTSYAYDRVHNKHNRGR